MQSISLVRISVFIAVIAAGCASSKGGGNSDADIDSGGGGIFDGGTDANGTDAGPINATCESCENNANCEEDHRCVLFGGEWTCLPRCLEQSDCPADFTCGGVEILFCAPTDGVCCIDGDDDDYGDGFQCEGLDCDDTNPDIHPGMPELCNDVDDDCDAATDDGSNDALIGVACDGGDADLCDEGLSFCDVGGVLGCDDVTGDTLDVCDGVDNDCDPTTLDGAADALLGTACDSPNDADLCLDDVYICNPAIPAIECNNLIGGGLELCDGADNDCNPGTPDGSGDPGVGVPCDGIDADLCEEGTSYCDTATILCDDPNDVDLDVCNGFDDDCNLSTDDGSQDPAIGGACDGGDTDLCAEGFLLCQSGNPICNDQTGNDVEICDGNDNDCNGAIDDLNANSVCPTQNPGAGSVSSWSCSGSCTITGCASGTGNIDTLVSNGCECSGLDSFGKTCSAATIRGVGLGGIVTETGMLESASDVDWLRFNFTNRGAPGNYHPRVRLTNTGGGQYTMDVYRTCSAIATCGSGTGANAGTWEGNWTYTSGPACCTDSVPHVTTVWVRIKRSGAATCTTYQVTADNP